MSIPIEGSPLRRFVFAGTAKEATVHIETEGYPRVVVPTDGGSVTMAFRTPMGAFLRSLDDVKLELAVVPAQHTEVILVQAEVDWPSDAEHWQRALEHFRRAADMKEWSLPIAVALRVAFAARPTPATVTVPPREPPHMAALLERVA